MLAMNNLGIYVKKLHYKFVILTLCLIIPRLGYAQCVTEVEYDHSVDKHLFSESYEQLHTPRTLQGYEHFIFGMRGDGSPNAYGIFENTIRKIEEDFPRASPITRIRQLKNGDFVGLAGPIRKLYLKRVSASKFQYVEGSKDHYWYSFEEGSKTLFVKTKKDGLLMELQDGELIKSNLPYVQNHIPREYLPWYSRVLDGFFIGAIGDIWFIRRGDDNWSKVSKAKPSSFASNWGFYQQGSKEVLSADGKTLKVISKTGGLLTLYEVKDGRPVAMINRYGGKWHLLEQSGEIVGWYGHRTQYFSFNEQVNALSNPPRFAFFSPNDRVPNLVGKFKPRAFAHSHNNTTTVFYTLDIAQSKNSDAIILNHDGGYAYYSRKMVSDLPAFSEEIVGDLPKFFKLPTALYIAGSNGVFRVTPQQKLVRVLELEENRNVGTMDMVALNNDGSIILTFNQDKSLYYSENNSTFEKVFESESKLKIVGNLPNRAAALISIRGQGLKIFEAKCSIEPSLD